MTVSMNRGLVPLAFLIISLYSPVNSEPLWVGPRKALKQALQQVASAVPRIKNSNNSNNIASPSLLQTETKSDIPIRVSSAGTGSVDLIEQQQQQHHQLQGQQQAPNRVNPSETSSPNRTTSSARRPPTTPRDKAARARVDQKPATRPRPSLTRAAPSRSSPSYKSSSSSCNKNNHSIGGAIVAAMQNPRLMARWSLAGLQVGIAFYLGQAVWQAARDVLSEFEDATGGGGGGATGGVLKAPVVMRVLQEIQQEQPVHASEHTSLHRVTVWLRTVTGWQLMDQDPTKPSLQRFLMSLSRNEYSILEQCLYVPTSNSNMWEQIHGIPDIQQAVLDRLNSARYCPTHNPYAPILKNNHAGMLLYGPPGCGKTMLLQAVCSTIRSPCLILTPSVLLKKYVGETNQLIRSLFSLAQKLGDCVIVLDELDGLFRERRPDEHETSRELKTEFLQWWDGIVGSDHRILFVGATNRPFDVDSAILRRMSQAHFIGLPMGPARALILQKLLDQIPHSDTIDANQLAIATEGFSPSDLVQLVRTAVQQGPLREMGGRAHGHFRALQQHDLMQARQSMGPTPLSPQYRNSLIQFHQQQKQPPQEQYSSQQQSQLQPHQPVGGVQSTPWGTFYHAGTVMVDDYRQDEEDYEHSVEDGRSLDESQQQEDSLVDDTIEDELDDLIENRLDDEEWEDYDYDK